MIDNVIQAGGAVLEVSLSIRLETFDFIISLYPVPSMIWIFSALLGTLSAVHDG